MAVIVFRGLQAFQTGFLIVGLHSGLGIDSESGFRWCLTSGMGMGMRYEDVLVQKQRSHIRSYERIPPGGSWSATWIVPQLQYERVLACEKMPMQCRALCQTALSAESRSAKLDKSSKEARTKADKAARRAASIEEKTSRKLWKINMPKNASSPESVSPQAKSFWKLATIIPRLFVSHEANARSRQEEKEAKKYGVNPSPLPNYSSKEVSDLLMESQRAAKSAEESQKVAADVKMEADQARAYLDSARQSYKS